MSLSPLHRASNRALLLVSFCVAFLGLASFGTGSQQASIRSNSAAPRSVSTSAFVQDKGGITPEDNTITVNSTADVANSADGLCTLREAITAANTNTASGALAGECLAGSSGISDTIDLTGVTGTITLTSALPDISSDMTINGPGASTLNIQRSAQTGTPNFRIFTILTGTTVNLSGMTMSNGIVIGAAYPTNNGGAISNSGTLTLNNTTVRGNTAVSSGGGGGGGGIHNNDHGTLNINNSTVSGNTGGIGGGGGIRNGGSLNLTNTIVSGNTTGGQGGGISSGGPVTLTNCTIRGNTALEGGGLFNAISCYNAVPCPMNLNNSTVSGNTASPGNGGGILNSGTMTVTNTTVSGNHTAGSGGGIFTNLEYNYGSSLINCTVTGNSADSSSDAGGGGVYALGTVGKVMVKNTIVANNSIINGTGPDLRGTFVSQDYNLIGNTEGASLTGATVHNIMNQNANLGPLANNGGSSETHALLANSPALDAGDNCVTQTSHCGDANIPQLTTDQRGAGFNRIVDGPDADTIATVDIGAYEAQTVLAGLPDTNSNEDTQVLVPFDGGDLSTITSVTATSSNPTLVPNDAAHLSVITGLTGIVTINPAANLSGTTNITVTVNRTGGSENKTFMLTVKPVADTPSVTNATTNENTQTTSGLVISRNPADGNEVTNFKITNIQNGTLFKNDGTTQINNNAFITAAEGNSGLRFTPAPALAPIVIGLFQVQASVSNSNGGLGGGTASATITFNCGPTIVTNNNDSGPGSLRSAINFGCAGSPVTFDPAVTGTITLSNGELVINEDLTITGPGEGKLTVSANHNSRVINVTSGTVNISGLTISNGYLGGTPQNFGGGILNRGTLTLSHSTISHNGANLGGGIRNFGTLTLTNTTISENGASGSLTPQGGGIYNDGTLIIVNSAISDNAAVGMFRIGSAFGGGIYNRGPLTMTDSTISGNYASFGGGGGLENFAPAILTNCTISDNETDDFGAGIVNGSGAALTLTNCTISGNHARNKGGGIMSFSGTLTLTNCTISGNESYNNAGIVNQASANAIATLTLTNCTVVDNHSSGGAILTEGQTGAIKAETIIRNTLVAKNKSGNSATNFATLGSARLTDQGNNLDSDGSSTFTNAVNGNIVGRSGAPIDPLVAPLSNYGGLTMTHALSPRSPAINAGNNALITSPPFSGPPFTDQRGPGFDRILNGTVDIGAFESQFQGPPPLSVNELSVNDVSLPEGDSGTRTFTFTVTLSAPSSQTVTVNYSTMNFTANPGSDYVSTSGTLTFSSGDLTKTFGVTVNGDESFEGNEAFIVKLWNPVNATVADAQTLGIILNDDAQGGNISFSQASYSVGESSGLVTITVNRSGDTASAATATVNYATSDGSAVLLPCSTANGLASARCDFTTALGTLRFVAGETSKTFMVLISQDNYVEGPETLTLNLTNPTGSSKLGTNAVATLTIVDDPSEPAGNPIDDARAFVIQHYHDFLNREPDQVGLDFWTKQITSCGSDQRCIEISRINVSASFFLSIEFQETGFLVERMYKAAYGDVTGSSAWNGPHPLAVPLVGFNEFLSDKQQIAQGVIVLRAGWEQQLENNKQAFAMDFVQRARFTAAFPDSMTPEQFVNQLNQNVDDLLSESERAGLIDSFGGAPYASNKAVCAQVVRQVAEGQHLQNAEFNRAILLMQYYGYLRRNPNDPPDSDFTGYDFWLTKLNQYNGIYANAEIVKAFLSSIEYRQRFGP